MNLQREILSRLTDSDLVELQNKLPTLQADGELARRLRNGEAETLMAMTKLDEMTPQLRKALREYPMAWRVGVIYYYNTGGVHSLQIAVGEAAKKRYQINGRKIMFTWLDSKDHQMVLREVNNFVVQMNRMKIDNPEVLPFLLAHDELSVGVTELNYGRSYDTPLPGNEYTIIPNVLIDNARNIVYLNDLKGVNHSVYSGVTVQKSPEVEVYKSLLYR